MGREIADRPETEKSRRELEARVRQQETVARLGMMALSGTDPDALMDEACVLVAEALGVELVKVLEILPGGDVMLVRAGFGWREGTVGRATVGTNLESQAGYTLISDGPVVVEDLREEIRFRGAALLHDHGVFSGVTVVIRVRDHFFGVLGVHTRQRRIFSESEVRFLEDVAAVLGAAISRGLDEENVRLMAAEQSERAEAAERRFEFLAEANAVLSASALDYAATLENAARLAVPTVGDWCFVDVVEPDGRVVREAVAHAGGRAEELSENLQDQVPADPSAAHGTPKVLRTGRPELIREVDDEVLRSIALNEGHLEALRRLGTRSYMCVPLRVRGRTLGAMGFVELDRTYDEDDLALAEGLAHCAALAMDNARSHLPEAALARELVRLARRDGGGLASVPRPSADAPELTRRQMEVLRLMADGKPAREISRQLHLSEATVRNHIRAIKHALGSRSQLEAIARARKLGVLPR